VTEYELLSVTDVEPVIMPPAPPPPPFDAPAPPPPATTRYSTAYVDTAVIELLAALAALVPIAFVAVTVKVYDVPAVKPVTVIGELAPVAVILPGVDVTV
jgi:hypothetical protein